MSGAVLLDEPSANFNRASAGYTWDILLAMVAPVAAGNGFYADCGNHSSDTVIGHRDNHKKDFHAGQLKVAAKALRAYGLRVRISPRRGCLSRYLTVYGPKCGGKEGRYSA